ncbi:hypothetical protein TRFO_38105 [Tritrichomonas foetus]|uniref:Protein kinase domain-containing protein n=1 Tax=Tritrichomonas foetus TaxID=1144522 RepID=A0A1J4J9F2_9EUKA|nr:hypothetical protein TRFO_38105 [Tritrichomonas foetus]|eukprot:OHS95776.1 hypothetical protein TRFO_38105 [Tritrichomonas foetus]
MKEAIGPFRVFDDSPEDNFYRCLNMIQKQPSLCQRFSFNDLLLPNVTNRIRKYLKLSHQYLSKIVDFQLSTKHQTVSVFYESENLSLEEIISNINFFDTNFIISIAYQLLSVLRYLHSNDFSHRISISIISSSQKMTQSNWLILRFLKTSAFPNLMNICHLNIFYQIQILQMKMNSQKIHFKILIQNVLKKLMKIHV